MSSTATETKSPLAHGNIRQIWAVSSPDDRFLLTRPPRQRNGPPTATSAYLEEPPAKRIRLEPAEAATATATATATAIDLERLTTCLAQHVFPHVDSQISALPQDRVNTLEIGKQVVAFLTGPAFTREYERGSGTISPAFEAQLAAQAAVLVQALARHPDHQLAPSDTASPSEIARHRVETPILPPKLPYAHNPSISRQTASTPSPAPRFSTSPIPLPVIPNGATLANPPTKLNGTGIRRPSFGPAPLAQAGTPQKPIVIDDDDNNAADTTPRKVVVREKPVAQAIPSGPGKRLPNTEHPPKTEPLAAGPAPAAPAPPVPAASVARVTRPLTAPKSNPEDLRTQARALIWHGPRLRPNGEVKLASKWFTERRRPYLAAVNRTSVIAAAQRLLPLNPRELASPVTFHVDFAAEEVGYLRDLARRTLELPAKHNRDATRDLGRLLRKNRKNPALAARILDAFAREKGLPLRTTSDVRNLFADLADQRTRPEPVLLTLQRDDRDRRGDLIRSSRVHSLLLAREIAGQRGLGSMRCLERFDNEFRKCREDDLCKRAEWIGCAGDIFTIAWVSKDGFICGTTEHSDAHNQQYNKAGNLVLGSCSEMTLRAYPEHRIVRPVVEKGENSTEAMRQSLDPWLYSSVVSSDYDAIHDRAFTSSFDKTVKIWKVENSGASMGLLGEWTHDGNVNFVAASKHETGMIATAADVAADAVRIYDIDEADISKSPFRSYSCSRVTDERGNTVSTEKWAYFPATMQWGLADGVKHLLLVGYSPRSRTGDDNDIPVERRDSGELCLWDGVSGERWRVTSATTQNVFEVLWHPTQPCFIAATSPLGLDLEPSVRTQIRIFRPADNALYGAKAFSPVITLDCAALDVNELTIMPNSFSYCYITAGCTNGNTYVWDTARGDNPIHILRHGEPIDEYRGDREREDVGVKFTAWGTTPDRFYTGSSDGVVKVWNVRSLGDPLVRNLLEAPAPITAGMFCPDKSRLVVGDASGRVFLLSVDEEKRQPLSVPKVPLPAGGGGFRTIQQPPSIIPHPDPPPPTHDAGGRPIVAQTGPALGRAYLESAQLERHPNPTIGVVQGPRYAETGLFRREMHFNEDPAQPLLARWEAMQQEACKPPRFSSSSRRREQAGVLRPVKGSETLGEQHSGNLRRDLDWEGLPEETRLGLERDGVDLGLMVDYDFLFDFVEDEARV